MSYEPTNWKDGDLVTSAKLNKMEQGIAAGGRILIVHEDEGTSTLDKTWQEIYDADVCYIISDYDGSKSIGLVTSAYNKGVCVITVLVSNLLGPTILEYHSNSPDDYPIYIDSNEENEGGVIK